MRAVCYCRVSSAGQRDRETIASQLKTLPEFIARMGWTLVKPIETYIDDGRSARAGKLDARDGFSALLRDMALGLFDVVCVVDVNRLTRSEDLTERGMILGAFQRAGVKIAASGTGQVLDLSTSVGDLFGSLQAFFAAEESRKRSESVRRGKLSAAQRGGKATGRGPWWLRYDREHRAWNTDAERAAVIVEMFERVAAGESCSQLETDFVRRGVPPLWTAPWNRQRIRDQVGSRAAVGEYVSHASTKTIVAVPAIVTEELWQAANAMLRSHRTTGLRRTKHAYLLEGIAMCSCGSPMRIKSATTQNRHNGKSYWNPARYVCASKQHWRPRAVRDVTPCESPSVICDDADARAWAAFCRELDDPDLPAELAADRRAIATDAHNWESDADGYRAHIARLEKVTEGLLSRFRRDLISEDDLDRELGLVNREKAAVRAQLASAERARGATKSAQARLHEATEMTEQLRAKMAIASPEERRQIFSAVVDVGGVIFDGKSLRVDLLLEKPDASTGEPLRALANTGLSSDGHESRLRIRLVA